MKPKEMSISVSRTFNLGNLGFLKLEGGMAASIEEGDDPDVVRAKLLEEIRKSLSAAYRANYPRDVR
jgi:hypothetical protein